MGQVVREVKSAATLDEMIELLVYFTEQHAQFADNLEQLLPAFCSAQFLARHVDRMERLDLKRIADKPFGNATVVFQRLGLSEPFPIWPMDWCRFL